MTEAEKFAEWLGVNGLVYVSTGMWGKKIENDTVVAYRIHDLFEAYKTFKNESSN